MAYGKQKVKAAKPMMGTGMKKPSKKVMTKRTDSTNPMGKANKMKKIKKRY